MKDRQVNLMALRNKAEAAIAKTQSASDQEAPESDLSLGKLIEELRIYQTELEIQNQELAVAQGELSSALAKYRVLFSNLPLPALLVDARGFVVEANHHAQALLGLRQDAALQQRSILYFFDTESKAAVYQCMRPFAGVEDRQVGPLRLRLASGEKAPFQLNVIQIPDEVTNEILSLMVLTDRSAEEALRESEQTFHSFADSSMSLIWASGLDKLCFYFNRGWLEFTGRTLEEEYGNGWVAGVHPDDLDRCVKIYNENFDERRAFSMDYRLRRHDGEYRWIRDNGALRYDTKGNFCGYIGHCLDIHDRIEAENKLRTLSAVVEQSPESIVITDSNSVIQYVNPACEASTGYTREELIGQSPRVFNSGLTPRPVYQRMWETLHAGRPWTGQFSNRKKDGQALFEYVRIAPIRDASGEISNFFSIKEDIGEKKRIAEELDHYRQHLEEMVSERTVELAHAKEEAEVANVAKSAFLANMSHEIRTPMNAVMMLTHLLRNTPLNPEQQNKLQKIQTASEHLLQVISDILDISKIEAGKLVLEQRDFVLHGLLQSALDMVRDKAVSKGLVLHQHIAPELGAVKLRGDDTRIRQALVNYLNNAIKFTEHGEISLSAERVTGHGSDILLKFSVKDTGIGISEENLPRLFNSFEQADNSMTRRFGGTGLGLVITRRIAQVMHGDAGVESTLGEGSRFWLTVRLELVDGVLNLKKSEATAASEANDLIGHGNRVLVCEDEPINQEILGCILTDLGYQVDTAENGIVAIEMTSNAQYDLILMDMQMPEIDGIEATKCIRRLENYQRVPIIALTANAFESDRQACIEAGMNDFVTKPVYPETLEERIRHWLVKA
jgi:two-component system, sensor histidine kinase and response regulator